MLSLADQYRWNSHLRSSSSSRMRASWSAARELRWSECRACSSMCSFCSVMVCCNSSKRSRRLTDSCTESACTESAYTESGPTASSNPSRAPSPPILPQSPCVVVRLGDLPGHSLAVLLAIYGAPSAGSFLFQVAAAHPGRIASLDSASPCLRRADVVDRQGGPALACLPRVALASPPRHMGRIPRLLQCLSRPPGPARHRADWWGLLAASRAIGWSCVTTVFRSGSSEARVDNAIDQGKLSSSSDALATSCSRCVGEKVEDSDRDRLSSTLDLRQYLIDLSSRGASVFIDRLNWRVVIKQLEFLIHMINTHQRGTYFFVISFVRSAHHSRPPQC